MSKGTNKSAKRIGRHWRFLLLGLAVVVVVFILTAGTRLANEIRQTEKQKIELWAKASKAAAMSGEYDESMFLELILDILESNTTIPLILVDGNDVVISGANFGKERDNDRDFLSHELEKIKRSGADPIVIETSYFRQLVYYKDSLLLQAMTWFPLVVIFLAVMFIALAWFFYYSDKQAEQHYMWVGMAKETAHQLGTPISAILAWVELMRSENLDEDQQALMVREMLKDVDRLQTVAERFSKIGSIPELQQANIFEELQKAISYIRARSPRKVRYTLPDMENQYIQVMLNIPLFNWVLENLFKNALDALDGKGNIVLDVFEDLDYVYIDISDDGRGMNTAIQAKVFQPGFTTKARGWGLGLSLAKRIIDDYHKGKLFIKNSAPGQGTTFRIQLPKDKASK